MKATLYTVIVLAALSASSRAEAGLRMNGPGLVLQGPGLVLQGPGLVLQGPGLVLQGPMLAGPAERAPQAGSFAYPHSLVEACAAPIPRGEWPLSALDGRAVRVSLPN